jgi:hypothetical protein
MGRELGGEQGGERDRHGGFPIDGKVRLDAIFASVQLIALKHRALEGGFSPD